MTYGENDKAAWAFFEGPASFLTLRRALASLTDDQLGVVLTVIERFSQAKMAWYQAHGQTVPELCDLPDCLDKPSHPQHEAAVGTGQACMVAFDMIMTQLMRQVKNEVAQARGEEGEPQA